MSTEQPYARPNTQYVRATTIQARYGLSPTLFYKLRHLADPLRRFPNPTLILGDTPLWSEDVLTAWDAAQKRDIALRQRIAANQEAEQAAAKKAAKLAERQRIAAEKETASLKRVADREARQRREAAKQAGLPQVKAMRKTQRQRRAAEKHGGIK
jgi:hypothetical protein